MKKPFEKLGKTCIFLLMFPLMMAGVVMYVVGCIAKSAAWASIGRWRSARLELIDIKSVW